MQEAEGFARMLPKSPEGAPGGSHIRSGVMTLTSRRQPSYLLGGILLLGLLTGPYFEPAAARDEGSGGRFGAHRAGGEPAPAGQADVPGAVLLRTGFEAVEPTIGIADDGTIFYAATAPPGSDSPVPTENETIRSRDDGKTWELISPHLGPQHAHPISLDPYVYVDIGTEIQRLFSAQLTVACTLLSFSDDQGETWITNPLACGRMVNDHQTIFSGVPVLSPTAGYPKIVYYCWNDVATTSCSKSLDGGLTFVMTGTPAFMGYQPNGGQGHVGVEGLCGGYQGQGVADKNGYIYIPREFCKQPALAISRDEGATWTNIKVAGNGSAGIGSGATNPAVDVDEKGNIYFVWIAEDRLPYLAISTDEGKTFGPPLMIAAPGVTEANLVTIDVGAPEKIAVAYMGSTNSEFQECTPECTAENYKETTWNGYMMVSTNALSPSPLFLSGSINDVRDPLLRGTCGPGRCGVVFDFIDVQIGPDGRPWGAFVDGCLARCNKDKVRTDEDEGIVATTAGGPRLN